jgi:hypothetical protein
MNNGQIVYLSCEDLRKCIWDLIRVPSPCAFVISGSSLDKQDQSVIRSVYSTHRHGGINRSLFSLLMESKCFNFWHINSNVIIPNMTTVQIRQPTMLFNSPISMSYLKSRQTICMNRDYTYQNPR